MKKLNLSWSILFLITAGGAFLYIFNEWLFAVTRPYFMNDLGLLQQLNILCSVSALLIIFCFLALLPLFLLSLLRSLRETSNVLILLGAILPAVVFATLILILVDNFTYTVFKWGIVSTSGWLRGLYGLAFLATVALCYRSVFRNLKHLSKRNKIWGLAPKQFLGMVGVILLVSVGLLALPDRTKATVSSSRTVSTDQRPNIILITADGVNATHTSLYGYSRETTPNLSQLAETSLVAENAFSNAGNSPGSVISMYTGKYPAKTRVIYPPDILKGQDSHEHLPALLRAQGYKTVQITVPYYIDAKTLNLLDGFDEIKLSNAVPSKLLTRIGKFLPNDHALFTDETIKRIVDRLRHIFFIKKMDNPYLEVTGMHARRVDIERWVYLRQEIENATQPLFIHVHLMVTHGEDFFPMEQNFSAGQSMEDQKPWNDDFYDDAILDFDKNLGDFVNDLTASGFMDSTILIVGSDHGEEWNQLRRVPLLIHFPNGEYAGHIQSNVQHLDIAPTILDYMGLPQPEWMRGTSLIAGDLPQRPILGVNDVDKEKDENNVFSVNWDHVGPPFYQFGGMSVIYCEKWFKLDLSDFTWETGDVEGSTSTCASVDQLTDERAFQLIVDHLRENGFDVSTLDGMTPWNH